MDAKVDERIDDVPVADNAMPVRRPRVTLSPLNRRRLANFQKNRRGYWSFWIFLALFIVTLFAEVIANDKPLLMSHNGSWFVPVLNFYPETAFGGEFETEADYRDPALACLVRTGGNDECLDDPAITAMAEGGQKGWMLFPPIRYSYNTRNLDKPATRMVDGEKKPFGFPSPPSWLLGDDVCAPTDAKTQRFCALGNYNWLGTDNQGRDVLARVIYGFRISVLFGLILTVFSSVIGVAAGAVQGYFGGWVDLGFQRFIEIWTSIPQLYLLIIVASIITPSFWILLGILLLFSWVALVGVVRAEFLRGRNFEYVQAARALGVTNTTIMFKHLLPNAMVATLTLMPFILNSSITSLTALDFLGFGLPPGSPSLGELLAQGKESISAPWLGLTAFFVIAIMLSLLVFIGEAVRDALDPRKTFE